MEIIGLSLALIAIANKLAEKAIVDPALESGLAPFSKWLTGGLKKAKAEKDLQAAFISAFKKMDAPVDDDAKLADWLKGVGLDRLQSPKNSALREQTAIAIVQCVNPHTPPPAEMMTALAWPHSRQQELSALLYDLRSALAKPGSEWLPLIELADRAAERGLLREMLSSLAPFKTAFVEMPEGNALRVVLSGQNLTEQQSAEIERAYRAYLKDELEYLDTQGFSFAQLQRNIRLKLEEAYLELGMLPMSSERDREEEKNAVLEMPEADRLKHEHERMNQRVSDALAENHRLVIVGKPGSGKTVSLKFIAFMLANGLAGANRLRLDIPYIPLFVRLADYAEKLKDNGSLALETFLIAYIDEHYPGKARQAEFLRMALEKNACLVLLDGLDEVGDIGDTPIGSKTLRATVLDEVRRFAERRCKSKECNRVIVTSRMEGYRTGDVPGFVEMELSPLRVPDEMQDFLLHWFTAFEMEYQRELPQETAQRRAEEGVRLLVADIMRSESVQRLAMNPLLLTILAMIHQSGTRLPEKRAKLYKTVTVTLVENWRYGQTRHDIAIHKILSPEKIHELLATLAYWLHENKPDGTMSIADWEGRIKSLLIDEEDDDKRRRDMESAVQLFLRHAREEAGLLTERSPGQIGFFHLTLEEYLAAVEIARQESSDDRREMIEKHWQDPHWYEVILLTAGEMAITGSKALNTFINDLRVIETKSPALMGRPVLLAGKAIVDVGPESFKTVTLRDVKKDLQEIAQDLDGNTNQPAAQARFDIQTRAAAADTLDELGWAPSDLYTFVEIKTDGGPRTKDRRPPSSVDGRFYIAKYPVTNSQYQRFLEAGDFAEPKYWTKFPKYSEPDKEGESILIGDWGDKGYEWLEGALKNKELSPDSKIVKPRYWDDPRFGIARKSAPVVGVTWYEVNAYCKWLTDHQELPEFTNLATFNLQPSNIVFRLPTEKEWILAAGGLGKPLVSGKRKEKDELYRFPWDDKDKVTPNPTSKDDQVMKDILRRANIDESGINRTTPVWMYPLGKSPLDVWDMGGNVWEWQANNRDEKGDWRALRGGSWLINSDFARVSYWNINDPGFTWFDYGFRVLVFRAPPSTLL
jgi:formylglycine-generating enzyme required for sulfatase activity